MLAKLPLRSKLVLVVAVPLFVLLGFAGAAIVQRTDALSDVQQYSTVLPAFDATSNATRAIGDDGVALSNAIARSLQDRGLATSLAGVVSLDEEQLASAHEAAIGMTAITGDARTAEFKDWISAITAQQTARSEFLATASSAERRAFDEARSGGPPSDPLRRSDLRNGELPAGFAPVEVAPSHYYNSYRDK